MGTPYVFKQTYAINKKEDTKDSVVICHNIDSQITDLILETISTGTKRYNEKVSVSSYDINSPVLISHIMNFFDIKVSTDAKNAKLYNLKINENNIEKFLKDIRENKSSLLYSDQVIDENELAWIVFSANQFDFPTHIIPQWNTEVKYNMKHENCMELFIAGATKPDIQYSVTYLVRYYTKPYYNN